MAKTDTIDIGNVASLASLTLTVEEKAKFTKQLADVVTYISSLNELETENVEPIGNITGQTNVTRDDEPAPSLTQEEALKNAKKTANGFIEVDAIFKGE